jgi:hypothetical protein
MPGAGIRPERNPDSELVLHAECRCRLRHAADQRSGVASAPPPEPIYGQDQQTKTTYRQRFAYFEFRVIMLVANVTTAVKREINTLSMSLQF